MNKNKNILKALTGCMLLSLTGCIIPADFTIKLPFDLPFNIEVPFIEGKTLDQKDFTGIEKTVIGLYTNYKIPFATCYSYTLNEVGEANKYLSVTFNTTEESVNEYTLALTKVVTLSYDKENDKYVYEDENYKVVYFTSLDGKKSTITLNLFSYNGDSSKKEKEDSEGERGSESVSEKESESISEKESESISEKESESSSEELEFLNQNAFTSSDNKIIAENFNVELPFCKCYEYEVTTETDAYGDYASIYFATSKTESEKYFTSLDNLLSLEYDEEYEEYYYESEDYALEYFCEEEDGIYYVYMYAYSLEEEQEETTTGIVVKASNMTGLTTSYSTFEATISNVKFGFSTVSYAQQAEGYDNIVQAKKNISNSIYNITAFDGLTSLTVGYAPNPSSKAVKEFTITGGSSQNATTITATAGTATTSTVDGISISSITYTFASSVQYVNFATTGATYFNYINFGGTGSGGTGEVTLIDDGNGYSTVDFTIGEVRNVTELGDYIDGCPTTGNLNVLVIPVDFSDCTAASKGYTVDKINKAFNGQEDNTFLYYSVAKYLNMSSYGKLNVTFDVVDEFVRAKYASSQYENDYTGATSSIPAYTDIYGYASDDSEGSYATSEMLILNECLSYLDKTKNYDLSKYDSDDNGTIDAVIMIYTQDIDEEDAEFFWAWRYWNMLGDTSVYYNGEDDSEGYDWYKYDGVYANDYLWASYQFLFESEDGQSFDSTSTINTYTFIHEFSHVLGADDYYDYSYESEPMQGYDMMDSYSCDHNAFTKAYLGWIENARIVTTADTVTLELTSFEQNGDAIILANGFDKDLGLFQEYFIIQYYEGQTGLYTKNGDIFEADGILVYHVNATATYDSEYEGYYLDNNNTTYTSDTTYGTDNNLIEIVNNGEGFIFEAGDTLSNVKFDDGSTLGFSFTVTKVEEGKATITFTRTAKSED